jgi:hypothetical protein
MGNMRFLRFALLVAITAASAACIGPLKDLFSSPTDADDTTTVRSYIGNWAGAALTTFPTAQTCGNVQWKVASQTGSQISGDFQATCAGGMTLVGTVVASANGDAISWAASGNATQGETTCPFTMTGTGTFQGTSNIVLNYAGTMCFGPVSGSETITRS